jgi:hypothetical protein
MKASVEVIYYKVRPLKNGEYPLMLRITKSRKRKYISIGISVKEKFWDFDKNKPKRNCPNKEQIERLIASKTAEYNDLIVEQCVCYPFIAKRTLSIGSYQVYDSCMRPIVLSR